MLFKRPSPPLPKLPYNVDALEFFVRNGLTIDDVKNITEKLVEPKEVDSIVGEISLFEEEVTTNVSIADIFGYDSPRVKDLFESVNEFFDQKKDGYHTRSLDMLFYNCNNVMSGLSRSFIVEPIKVSEIKPNTFFIAGNGMHRFTLLRILYLIEKNRLLNPASDENLRKKYTIPVISKRLDTLKTYCAYLLKIFDDNIRSRSELDEKYRKTGKIQVFDGTDKKAHTFTDEELIIYTNEIIVSKELTIETLIRLSSHIEINPDFRTFLNHYFSDLLIEVERFIEYKTTCKYPSDLYEYQINNNKKDDESWTL